MLFLQGGARLQFSMIPMNLLGDGRRPFDYIVTGSWSKYAAQEAAKFGEARVVWDGKATNYDRLPAAGRVEVRSAGGVCLLRVERNDPGRAVSDGAGGGRRAAGVRCVERFFEPAGRRQEVRDLYACAQKNAGPAGRDDRRSFARTCSSASRETLPGYLNFKIHAEDQIAVEHAADVSDLHR